MPGWTCCAIGILMILCAGEGKATSDRHRAKLGSKSQLWTNPLSWATRAFSNISGRIQGLKFLLKPRVSVNASSVPSASLQGTRHDEGLPPRFVPSRRIDENKKNEVRRTWENRSSLKFLDRQVLVSGVWVTIGFLAGVFLPSFFKESKQVTVSGPLKGPENAILESLENQLASSSELPPSKKSDFFSSPLDLMRKINVSVGGGLKIVLAALAIIWSTVAAVGVIAAVLTLYANYYFFLGRVTKGGKGFAPFRFLRTLLSSASNILDSGPSHRPYHSYASGGGNQVETPVLDFIYRILDAANQGLALEAQPKIHLPPKVPFPLPPPHAFHGHHLPPPPLLPPSPPRKRKPTLYIIRNHNKKRKKHRPRGSEERHSIPTKTPAPYEEEEDESLEAEDMGVAYSNHHPHYRPISSASPHVHVIYEDEEIIDGPEIPSPDKEETIVGLSVFKGDPANYTGIPIASSPYEHVSWQDRYAAHAGYDDTYEGPLAAPLSAVDDGNYEDEDYEDAGSQGGLGSRVYLILRDVLQHVLSERARPHRRKQQPAESYHWEVLDDVLSRPTVARDRGRFVPKSPHRFWKDLVAAASE
ncbi:unnamed protein product [Darwinula stevensoni]|uniref:Uncharacterized protein n=1 Tax=Darwinula stevensoni TaxID=69355 RepID=A0A7R8XD31_9CRUS|nr:unnamed protein product [Darwinula stevensoni]CAG0892619.1 unnamed protein product [Darwinula stevensoni]